MTTEFPETYLGDGVYASYDGYQYRLRAVRSTGDHFVYLEYEVVEALLTFITAHREG